MGVDLRLLPVEGQWTNEAVRKIECYAHTMIECGRDRDIYDALEAASKPQPSFRLTSVFAVGADGEATYGEVKDTPYGSPIAYITREDFIRIVQHDGLTDRTRAALAWVEAALHIKHIGLYWH